MWKTVQKRSKIKKKTKLAILALGFLLTLLLLSQIFQFWKLLNRPHSLLKDSKNYTWDGEFNLNFVVWGGGVSLVSYNPKEREVTIINIPDETYMEVPFGFGEWQARSIYELGQGSERGGANLLKKSVSSLFGIPVDGFSSENLVDTPITKIPSIRTDLTLWELIRLKGSLLQIRFDKIKRFDLEEFMVLETALFKEQEIVSEQLSVAVFNATDKPYAAQKAKKLIENLGGSVIVTANAPLKLSKSYAEGQESKTLKRLTQIFDLGCSKDPKCDKIPKNEMGAVSQRAQIILVLGEDF